MREEEYRNYHGKGFYNKVLFESTNFIVIPSLGSLVNGWLLIVPKEEFLSMKQIRNTETLVELEELSASIGEIMIMEYGCVTMFEHGAQNVNSTVGCGVDYAHLHLVPVDFDLLAGLEVFLQLKFSWNEVGGISDLFELSNSGKEYLFLKGNRGKSMVSFGEKIPSQLFRKVIAWYLNAPEKYDWKSFPEYDNISETIKRYRKYPSNVLLKNEVANEHG